MLKKTARSREKSKKPIIIYVDSSLFDKETVLSAAYMLTDRAYVLANKSPDGFAIELIPKNNGDWRFLSKDFMNELLNQSVYLSQSKKTLQLRQMLIAGALHLSINEKW